MYKAVRVLRMVFIEAVGKGVAVQPQVEGYYLAMIVYAGVSVVHFIDQSHTGIIVNILSLPSKAEVDLQIFRIESSQVTGAVNKERQGVVPPFGCIIVRYLLLNTKVPEGCEIIFSQQISVSRIEDSFRLKAVQNPEMLRCRFIIDSDIVADHISLYLG